MDAPPSISGGLPKFEIDRRRFAALAFLDIEGDFLAFREGRFTCPFDCRDGHEDVLRAIVRLNEAVTLLRVEPFNCTVRHFTAPLTSFRHANARDGSDRGDEMGNRVRRLKRNEIRT